MTDLRSIFGGRYGPLLKITAIGVAVLVLAIAAGTYLSMQSVEKAVGDFRAHPARAAAMVAINTNREFDLVATNDGAGEMTVRNRKTGEELIVSFDSVVAGDFRGRKAGDEPAAGDGAPRLAIKPPGEDAAGGERVEDATPPSWVPVYPGAVRQGSQMKVEKLETVAGGFTAQSPDAVGKVKAFFEEKLKGDGFAIESTGSDAAADTSAVVSGKAEGNRTIMVLINAEKGATSLVINYEGPKQ